MSLIWSLMSKPSKAYIKDLVTMCLKHTFRCLSFVQVSVPCEVISDPVSITPSCFLTYILKSLHLCYIYMNEFSRIDIERSSFMRLYESYEN